MSSAHETEALVTGKRKRELSRKALENIAHKNEQQNDAENAAGDEENTAPVKRARESKRTSSSASTSSAGPNPGKAGINKESTPGTLARAKSGSGTKASELEGDASSSSSTASKKKGKGKGATKAIAQLEDPFKRFSGFFFESLFPFLDLASALNLSHCNSALEGKVKAMLGLSAQTVYGSLQSAPAPSDTSASTATGASRTLSSPTVGKRLVKIAAARKGWSNDYIRFCRGKLYKTTLGSPLRNWGRFVRYYTLFQALDQRSLELRGTSDLCRAYIEKPAGEGKVPLMQVVATMWLANQLFGVSPRAWSNFYPLAKKKMHKLVATTESAGDWMLSAQRAWETVSTRARSYESDEQKRDMSRRHDRLERELERMDSCSCGGNHDEDDDDDDDGTSEEDDEDDEDEDDGGNIEDDYYLYTCL